MTLASGDCVSAPPCQKTLPSWSPAGEAIVLRARQINRQLLTTGAADSYDDSTASHKESLGLLEASAKFHLPTVASGCCTPALTPSQSALHTHSYWASHILTAGGYHLPKVPQSPTSKVACQPMTVRKRLVQPMGPRQCHMHPLVALGACVVYLRRASPTRPS